MLVRLGNVLFLASILVAIGWTWPRDGRGLMDLAYVEASIFVLVGIAARQLTWSRHLLRSARRKIQPSPRAVADMRFELKGTARQPEVFAARLGGAVVIAVRTPERDCRREHKVIMLAGASAESPIAAIRDLGTEFLQLRSDHSAG